MKGISYRFTKKRKVICLMILFFIVIFILIGIFCLLVYREDQKIVEKEISEINAFQKNQKLKPLFVNQTQQLYNSILTELSIGLPTIDTSENSRIKPACDESVQKFQDIPRVITPINVISLDYINNLFVYFNSTSFAYSRILRACLNYQTKQMIALKKYNIDVLRRLINYMLSKETFGMYLDNIIVLNNVLKLLKEKDIDYVQSFFVIYKEELQTFDDVLNQIVICRNLFLKNGYL